MASVGGKSSNETKIVAAGMKQLATKVTDLKSTVASLDKLQAQIAKNPDECKKSLDELEDKIADLTKTAKALEGIIKNTSKGVVK